MEDREKMSFIEGKASKKKCSFGGGGMQLDDYTNVDLIAFFGKSVFLKGRRTWMCVFFEKKCILK